MGVHWTEISPSLSEYGPFGAVNRAWYYSRQAGTGVNLILLLNRVLPGFTSTDYAWLAQTVGEAQAAGAMMADLAPGESVPLDAIPIVPGSAHGGAGGRRVRISGEIVREHIETGEVERLGGASIEEPVSPDIDAINRALQEIEHAGEGGSGKPKDQSPLEREYTDEEMEDWEIKWDDPIMTREF